MAITRRLSGPKPLFLFVCLCLALNLSQAARVPSDQFVFPSEPNPNATAIRLESRLKEIDRELEAVTRMTNVTLLAPKEAKKGTPRTSGGEIESEKPGSTSSEAKNVTKTPSSSPTQEIGVEDTPNSTKNRTQSSSEAKMITFARESEPDKPAPWEQSGTTIVSKPGGVIIGPRIILETSPKCPEGMTLTVNDHCRKIA
ncbi:uncharacterized protein LOC108093649 [Drosophila ficusphila]|uniref:uncharacterized protein LOC108093649 n=1 Tax=Drosophila ficusphila TaxID=30025 RepID=UPI0007E7FDA5|nr:uncharacterized protein LOC108093649 [Drosophila ficusphila]